MTRVGHGRILGLLILLGVSGGIAVGQTAGQAKPPLVISSTRGQGRVSSHR